MKKPLMIAIEGDGTEDDFSADDTQLGTDPAENGADAENEDDPSDQDNAEDADTSSDDADQEEDPAEAVVELPDTENMGVDELADLKEKDEKSEIREAARQEEKNLVAQLDDLTVVGAAMESYRSIARGLKTNYGAEIAQLNRIRSKYGYAGSISIESHDPKQREQLALEGFKETLKAIYDKIVETIKKIIDFIKKLFKDFFNENKRVKDQLSKLHESVVKLDSARGKELTEFLKRKNIDLVRYCEVGPMHKKHLTYQGKFLNECTIPIGKNLNVAGMKKVTYDEMLDRSLELLNTFQYFTSPGMVLFATKIDQFVAHIPTLDMETDCIEGLKPEDFMPADSVHCARIDSFVCPDDSYLFVSSGYLGDAYYSLVVPRTKDEEDLLSLIGFIGKWNSAFGFEAHTPDMLYVPRMETKDISQITQRMLEINNVVSDFEEVYKKYELLIAHVRQAMEKARDGIKNEPGQAMDQDEILRKCYYVAAAQAAKAWVLNTSYIYDSLLKYGKSIQLAWCAYVLNRHNKDISYMRSINAEQKDLSGLK